MNQRTSVIASLCLAWSFGLAASVASAQTNYTFIADPGAAEANRQWHIGAHWEDPLGNHFVPNVAFNERAIINNGATAVLTVNSPNNPASFDSVVTPGAVVLENGGLDIRAGGELYVTALNGAPGSFVAGGSGTGTLLVNPGGVLDVDSTLSVLGSNVNNSITVGGASGAAATVVANAAVLGASTTLYPNAAFSTVGGANIQGTGTYNVVIDGNGSNGKINVGTSVAVGGALNLDFAGGYTPVGGDSWTLVEANVISGGFSSVTSNAPLAFNETLVISQTDLGGGRRGLNATINEVLILEVNRDTGNAVIKHPGASTITLDGYFVGSNLGALSANDADWNSLNEGGQLGADWVETAQTVNNIGELKIGADATFGADVDLGPIYNALAGSFGDPVEDIEFGYRRASDSVEFPGIVQYTGTKANTLVLQVDPTGAGDAFLRNTSDTTVQIDAYEILSTSGALSTAGWDSLDDQNGPGNVWLEALNNDATQLAEFDSQGFTTIAPGDALNLGPLFTASAQDLELNFLMMGQSDSTAGIVIYELYVPDDLLPGDFNGDGKVDILDLDILSGNFGTSGGATLAQGDANGDGNVDILDLDILSGNFGSMASASAAIPEPSTAVLAALAAAALIRRRN